MWQNVENEKVENQEQYLLNSLLFLVFFLTYKIFCYISIICELRVIFSNILILLIKDIHNWKLQLNYWWGVEGEIIGEIH